MSQTGEFRSIMDEYTEAVRNVQKNRKMFDGVMGLGNHPGNAPSHETLDKKVESLCLEAAGWENSEDREALIREISQAALDWEGPEYARLMLVAVQRHTLELIPKLEPEGRERLTEWYQKAYPRIRRLPVQNQVLSALKKGR